MKPSATTVSGAAAAALFGAAQVPGLPHWLSAAFSVGAAVGVAQLGYHASDCPPSCPGTDEAGRRRTALRQVRLPIVGAIAAAALFLAITGCTVPVPSQPGATNAPLAYIVDPRLMQASNAVVGGLSTAGQAIPQAAPLAPIAALVFALVGAISAAVARNRSASAAALADAVVAAGPGTVDDVSVSVSGSKAGTAALGHIHAARVRRAARSPAPVITARPGP